MEQNFVVKRPSTMQAMQKKAPMKLSPVLNVVLLPCRTQLVELIRLRHGSGATFEIIQFSNLNLVRHGN